MRLGAVVLVGVVVSTTTVAARPRGKVIRVERTRTSVTAPRVCEIEKDGDGVCFGPEPAAGDPVVLMDENGVVAEATLLEANGYQTGARPCSVLWTVKTRIVRGDLANAQGRTIGVIDREIHARKGRMLAREHFPDSPSGNASDQVMAAIDRDGDHTADILLVQSSCDGTVQAGSGTCLDTWSRINRRLVRVQQTNFATCGI